MQIMDSHVAGMLKMPPEQCQRALAALHEYQQTGERPDLSDDWALDAWWESIEPVLATSRGIAERRAAAGSRGGRARKARACGEQGETDGEQTEAKAKQTEAKAKQTEAKAKQTEAKAKQTEAKAKQTEAKAKQTEAKAKQSEANRSKGQAKAKQTQAEEEVEVEVEVNRETGARESDGAALDPLGGRWALAAYRRPTPSEVEGYVLAAGGHPISGEDFVAWYDDHGWPARGWHGTAMTWSRKRRDEAALGRRPGARAAPDASAFEAYGAAAVSAAEAFGEGEVACDAAHD